VELFFRKEASIKDVSGKDYPEKSKISRMVKLTKNKAVTVVIKF
jgi:hypothetical protein